MESQSPRIGFGPGVRAVAMARAPAWGAFALIVASLAGCSRSEHGSAASTPAAATAPAAAPTPPASASAATPVAPKGEVGSLRLQALAELPPPPKAVGGDGEASDECREPVASDEARAAEAAGWIVYGEREWAGYRAVGVARAGTRLAGMGCVFPQGRVLLFRDGRPLAQVIDSGADADAADAGLQSLEEGAADASAGSDPSARRDGADAELRVGDWQGRAQARLRIDPDGGLELAALPATDRYCAGRASLPRLEALELPAARERLLGQGWRPAESEREEGEDGMRDALIAAGFPEVEVCSGTGMGYCNYHYRNPAGDRLQLTTAGEYVTDEPGAGPAVAGRTHWPRVAGHSLRCAGPASGQGPVQAAQGRR